MATPDRAPPMGQRFHDAYRTIPEPVIVAMLSLAGFAFEPDKAAAAAIIREALGRWCDSGLGSVSRADGLRLFDPVEVVAVLKVLARLGQDSFLAQHFAPTGQRLVQQLATKPATGFTMDFARRFHLPSVAPGGRVRLRAPLPLQDYHGPLAGVRPGAPASWARCPSPTDGLSYADLRMDRASPSSVIAPCLIRPSSMAGKDRRRTISSPAKV